MKHFYLIIPFFFLIHLTYGQSPLDISIDYNFSEVSYEEALNLLIKKSELNVVFSSDILPSNKKFTLNSSGKSVRYVLDNFIKNESLAYKTSGNLIILFYKKPIPKYFRLSGYVQDKDTGERLIASNISIAETTKGTSSNEYGFYSINLPSEEVVVNFSYLGYQSKQVKFNIKENEFLNVNLEPSITLEPIIVTPNKEKLPFSIRETSISSTSISRKKLADLPTFVGESDLIRSTLLLPGVTSAADGIGGIHVRGGNPDQNLILLDGAPIYNPFHTAGLFSVFNSNVVKNATLLKGAFPARYGGRISSVLDVRTKDGNNKYLEGEVGIGLVSAKGTLEGPFLGGKGSFIVSGRRTFIDKIIENQTREIKLRDTIQDKIPREGFSGYNFYDLNLKASYNFSDNDKIYLSYYRGADNFHDEERQISIDSIENIFFFDSLSQDLAWGNELLSFRWNHLFGDKLFLNTTITYSDFEFGSSLLTAKKQDAGNDDDFERTNFSQFISTITDIGGRLDFDYPLSDKHQLKFGGAYTHHTFTPGVGGVFDESITADSIVFIGEEDLDSLRAKSIVVASDLNVYIEDDISFSSKFKVNAGLHFTYFDVQDQLYMSMQPRIAAFYQLTDKLQLKGSYGRMRQHLHVLSNSNFGLPNDLWVPATKNIKPQDAWQSVLGFDLDLDNDFDLKFESYFKRMFNLISYQEGASFLIDLGNSTTGGIKGENWENKVTSGSGIGYGAEIMLEKAVGRTNGWLSYGYAHSTRQFDEINNGEVYPNRYDRRHNVKFAITHKITPWLHGNLNWIFSTGLATTLPRNIIIFEPPGEPEPPIPSNPIDFGPKNSTRLPNYHRLDAGFNIFLNKGGLSHIFNIGAYNIYNRRNPLYITFRERFLVNQTIRREFVEVSLIQFVPSFSYTLKFRT